jgi:hypothetical protein
MSINIDELITRFMENVILEFESSERERGDYGQHLPHIPSRAAASSFTTNPLSVRMTGRFS